jgi:TPR repeat protein
MVSAVWNLGLKERLGDKPAQPSSTTSVPAAPATPAAPPGTDTGTAAHAPTQLTPPPSPATPQNKAPASRLSPAENAEIGRKLLANQDFEQARVHLEQAVRDGDGGAACHLGEMSLKGQGGLAVDQDKAASLFQLAQSRNIICFAPGQ